MKTFVHAFMAFLLVGSTVAVAQSNLNSPHNYKRPVSQKSSKSENALVVSAEERAVPLKLKNNIASAHNYKRQGGASVEQEATLVLSSPVIGPVPQNPLLLPNHYKSQKPMKVEERVARKVVLPEAPKDSLSK
ncbi:MAG: hypothetical protein ACK41O_14080 [Runella zeae]